MKVMRESTFRRVINYEVKRNTSARLDFNFYIKNYMFLCYSKPTHNMKVIIQYTTF